MKEHRMIILERINQGVKIVADSVPFLWQHKKLFLYSIFLLLAYNLLFHNFVSPISVRHAPSPFTPDYVILSLDLDPQSPSPVKDAFLSLFTKESLYSLLPMIILAMFYTLGVGFFSIQIFDLLNNRTTSLRSTLIILASRVPLLISWSLLAGILSCIAPTLLDQQFRFLSGKMDLQFWSQIPAIMMRIIVPLLWMMLMFYITPLIAVNKLSFISSLKRAWYLAKNTIPEMIAIIGMLLLIPIFERPIVQTFLFSTLLWNIYMISRIKLYNEYYKEI
jgi:hypothetical protein